MKKSSKFYAVFNFLNPKLSIIYNNWTSCLKAISSLKEKHYKSFKTRVEAENFLAEFTKKFYENNKNNDALNEEVYTDGSFNPRCPYASWAWIWIKKGELKLKKSGLCLNPNESGNIDGEVEAVIQAAKWCEYENKKIKLYYDYEGIRSWALDIWERKSKISHYYYARIKKSINRISFVKVKAHSQNRWNDYVDELAKREIENYFKKTLKEN